MKTAIARAVHLGEMTNHLKGHRVEQNSHGTRWKRACYLGSNVERHQFGTGILNAVVKRSGRQPRSRVPGQNPTVVFQFDAATSPAQGDAELPVGVRVQRNGDACLFRLYKNGGNRVGDRVVEVGRVLRPFRSKESGGHRRSITYRGREDSKR